MTVYRLGPELVFPPPEEAEPLHEIGRQLVRRADARFEAFDVVVRERVEPAQRQRGETTSDVGFRRANP